MRSQDQVILALTAWRENRGGGTSGMQSVMNVVMNRAARHSTNAYTECIRPLQFSSLTAKGDLELNTWPADGDPQWATALLMAGSAAAGVLQDITDGATLYYAPHGLTQAETKLDKKFALPNGMSIVFPDSWQLSAVKYTCTIRDQVFFRQG